MTTHSTPFSPLDIKPYQDFFSAYSVSVSVLSFFFNFIVIYLVRKQRGPCNLCLTLILIIAISDILDSIVLLTKTITVSVLGVDNFRTKTYLYQIFGGSNYLLYFISSSSLALLALERYLLVVWVEYSNKLLWFIAMVHWSIGGILLSGAVCHQVFHPFLIIIESDLGNTDNNPWRTAWYLFLLISLLANIILLTGCYVRILVLRNQAHQLVINTISHPNNLEAFLNSDGIQLTDPLPSEISSVVDKDFISLNSDDKDLTSINSDDKDLTSINSDLVTITSDKDPIILQLNSDSSPHKLFYKMILMIFTYLLLTIPVVVGLIVASLLHFNFIHLNVLYACSLTSLQLINPCMVLFLHTRIQESLIITLKSLFQLPNLNLKLST